MGWKISLLEGRSLKTAAEVVKRKRVLTRLRILELLSLLQASMSVCRRAQFWGPGGGDAADTSVAP